MDLDSIESPRIPPPHRQFGDGKSFQPGLTPGRGVLGERSRRAMGSLTAVMNQARLPSAPSIGPGSSQTMRVRLASATTGAATLDGSAPQRNGLPRAGRSMHFRQVPESLHLLGVALDDHVHLTRRQHVAPLVRDALPKEDSTLVRSLPESVLPLQGG